MLGLLDYYRYTRNIVEPNIVKTGLCSLHFIVTLPATEDPQNVDLYIGNIVRSAIVKPGFHCTAINGYYQSTQRKSSLNFPKEMW